MSLVEHVLDRVPVVLTGDNEILLEPLIIALSAAGCGGARSGRRAALHKVGGSAAVAALAGRGTQAKEKWSRQKTQIHWAHGP